MLNTGTFRGHNNHDIFFTSPQDGRHTNKKKQTCNRDQSQMSRQHREGDAVSDTAPPQTWHSHTNMHRSARATTTQQEKTCSFQGWQLRLRARVAQPLPQRWTTLTRDPSRSPCDAALRFPPDSRSVPCHLQETQKCDKRKLPRSSHNSISCAKNNKLRRYSVGRSVKNHVSTRL